MYKIVGGDGKEYGPVTTEQIREWILQNRASATSLVAFEGGPFKPLSAFREFSDLLANPGVPPVASAPYVKTNVIEPPKTNLWAIAALVFGIIAIIPCCWMCPLPAVIGLILGIFALVQINRDPSQFSTTRTIPIVAIGLSITSIIIGFILFNSPVFKEQIRQMEKELRKISR